MTYLIKNIPSYFPPNNLHAIEIPLSPPRYVDERVKFVLNFRPKRQTKLETIWIRLKIIFNLK
jgi:hypothetical protein